MARFIRTGPLLSAGSYLALSAILLEVAVGTVDVCALWDILRGKRSLKREQEREVREAQE